MYDNHLFFLFSVSAQWIPPATVVKKVDSLEVVENDFKLILDTIISIEKQRWYYNNSTYFSISITNVDEICIVAIAFLFDDTQLFGFFYYNGEKFFVENYNLGDRLFKKTGIKVEQQFRIYGSFGINEETGKKRYVYSSIDDSRSIWLYKYNEKGKLELVEFINTDINTNFHRWDVQNDSVPSDRK